MTERDDTELTGAGLSPQELTALSRLLANPAVWEQPDPRLEGAVVAAIAAEAATAPRPAGDDVEVIPDGDRRPRRPRRPSPGRRVSGGWGLLAGAAVAATLIIVVIVTAALRRPAPDAREGQFALQPTASAPAGATADVVIEDRPDGARIDLLVEGLAPAPEDAYYELWLVEDQPGTEPVSAGTFHLRGGGGRWIELWAGVSAEEYPVVTVTLEREGDGGAGDVVLAGRVP